MTLPESPKFYYAQRQFGKARKGLVQIARKNRVDPEVIEHLETINFDSEVAQQAVIKFSETSAKQIRGTDIPIKKLMNHDYEGEVIYLDGHLRELWVVKFLRRNTIVFTLMLSCASFVYYFYNIYMKYIKGSLVINTIISATTEVLARLTGGLIFFKFGPKLSFASMFTLSSIGTVLLMFFWSYEAAVPVFIILSKFGITACYTMVFVAGVTMVPTIFAATVFGIVNACARVVTTSSSIAAELEYPTPLIISLGITLFGLIVSFFIIRKSPKFL